MRLGLKLQASLGIIQFGASILFALAAPASDTKVSLTNAADVLSLPEARAASQIPVLVTGTVTVAVASQGGSFFVQDATSGVFVDNQNGFPPKAGDIVQVSGVTEKGAYAPVITGPTVTKIGRGPLPAARPVSIDRFMSGAEDSQRIEVSGIVRTAEIIDSESNLDLEIASAGYRFHAFPKAIPGMDPDRLIGARVRLKGTSGAFFNMLERRLTAVKLFMPLPEDFVIEEIETAKPFDEPLLGLNNLAQYRVRNEPGRRVHVKGTVTFQKPGEELYLEDPTGGLRVRSRKIQHFSVGDLVEAVGFVDFEHFLPVLDDAEFRNTGETPAPVTPTPVTLEQILNGVCHAELVTFTGKLTDGFVQREHFAANSRVTTILMMQNGSFSYTAETYASDAVNTLTVLPIGATLQLTGVCLTESGEDGKTRSFQILMPTTKSVVVLAKPSWLTPQRLLTGLAVLLAVLIAAVSWTVIISKKNATLEVLVHEKEKARVELREAHDQLEQRVKERTAQLKLQISARKELELQSKATLAERTRLAQELHDTLEQALTGVALQLDTSTRLYGKEHESARHHLEIARNLVTEGQREVHRSIWNLRCRALEQFDLPNALLISSQQITSGSSLRVEVKTHGRVRPLPETVEENLLRIAQEALTNVIKHSGATLAEIDVDYGPKNVILQVKDNGRGFSVESCAGAKEGHFGLLGISERVKRLHGEITLESAPDPGTLLRVQIPISYESAVADPEAQLST